MTMTPTEASLNNSQSSTSRSLNEVELVSITDGKITGISVYPQHAEVTRLFNVAVKEGQNRIVVRGLPNVLDKDCLRVEGQGSATIHDVTISTAPPAPKPVAPPEFVALRKTQLYTQKALQRAQKALLGVERYVTSARTEHLPVDQLAAVVRAYDEQAQELDNRIMLLEAELEELAVTIAEQEKRIALPAEDEKLRLQVVVNVVSLEEEEVILVLTYVVKNASWTAGYDLRVDMQAKERTVDLTYKASITQSTGEDWNDVPLTLETATQSTSIGIPKPKPWKLSVAVSPPSVAPSTSVVYNRTRSARAPGPAAPFGMGNFSVSSSTEANMPHRELEVDSKGAGTVSATFVVPGQISIPSDGNRHMVTITRLTLDADISWICVPKLDVRVYLEAKIKNASEYTLLSGMAGVFIDGSFIAKSALPVVSPGERFKCSLGQDPAIRVTYHPIHKTTARTGLYSKSTMHSFSQNITLRNTKSASGRRDNGDLMVTVIDQVPLTEDEKISVKLVQPKLPLRAVTADEMDTGKVPPPIRVEPGIEAAWLEVDDSTNTEQNMRLLGKDGVFAWSCTVPAQTTVGLQLEYEVSASVDTKIVGL